VSTNEDQSEIRIEAQKIISKSSRNPRWEDTKVLIRGLQAEREFSLLEQITDRVARFDPQVPELRRRQSQALIETGKPAAALAVIREILPRTSRSDRESFELRGLRGRAYKQMFVENHEPADPLAIDLLKKSIRAYRTTYEEDPGHYWHGINWLALQKRAVEDGVASANSVDLDALAKKIMGTVDASHDGRPLDPWALATKAEASLALDDVDSAQEYIKEFLRHDDLTSFQVGSLRRQLEQIWKLGEKDEARQGLLSVICAFHAQLPGAEFPLSGSSVLDYKQQLSGSEPQFEAILGEEGPVTIEWWRKGLDAAGAVGSVIASNGAVIGTGFVVQGESIHDRWRGQKLVVTNFHVCNKEGRDKGLPPDEIEIAFSAMEERVRYQVSEVLYESEPMAYDCAILCLNKPLDGIQPIAIARNLPVLDQNAGGQSRRVFVIGHPGGRGLQFSVHDNEILDIEQVAGAGPQRLHYRTPTEPGSSGSPVFRSNDWRAIALHHAGGKAIKKLNGKAGTYDANEGISLISIIAAIGAV
jgi:hypothetical protein